MQKRAQGVDWRLNLQFEFTARDTPQQNSLAEVGFRTLYNKGRAMMLAANIPSELRYKLSGEAFRTATLLDGLMTVKYRGEVRSRFEHWSGQNPAFAGHHVKWGLAGTVKLKGSRGGKLANRGELCMMVGHAPDHSGDTYRMWNPTTGYVHTTRDIIWTKRMYFDAADAPAPDEDDDGDSTDESEEEVPVKPKSENYYDVLEVGENDSDDSDTDNSDDDSKDEDDDGKVTTRFGRVIQPVERFGFETNNLNMEHGFYECELTPAEDKYYTTMLLMNEVACTAADECEDPEVACVGAALGGGFQNTAELKAMKCRDVMAGPDKKEWEDAIHEECLKMKNHNVFKEVKKKDLPDGAKVLTSTWAMKTKSNGDRRARISGRGYEQVDGVHYREEDKSAPVVNEITIRICLILMIMAGWQGLLVDVVGAFLNGRFGDEEKVYTEVPEGFEKCCGNDVVLLLLRTIYGLKNAAMAYWKETLMAFKHMKFSRSKADPCLQFKWTKDGLVLWITWVDDCLGVGPTKAVTESKEELAKLFDVDDLGTVKECVGCKIDYKPDVGALKITQPVLIQSFEDEFELPNGAHPNTPAVPGEVLKSVEVRNHVSHKEQTTYRKGVGKLLHLKRWSRPEIGNAVRALSKFGGKAGLVHMNAMKRVMSYCVGTKDRGIWLEPDSKWNGDPEFEFVIRGKSDSDYAKDETRRSVSGWATFLNGAPVTHKSKIQPVTALSVTESETVSASSCVQDMIYEKRVVESVGLKVKLPMELEVDNKGTVDLVNNWSVGGNTRHVDCRLNFMRELKEAGILKVIWRAGEDNSADLFTKNLMGPAFEKHMADYVSDQIL